MKIISEIAARFRQMRDQYYQRQSLKRLTMLRNLSCSDINIMEFDGNIHISYRGIPVVRVDDIKIKAPDLLAQSRAYYLAWKAQFDK